MQQQATNGNAIPANNVNLPTLVRYLANYWHLHQFAFPAQVAAELFGVNYGEVLREIMDLDIPNFPECVQCEDSSSNDNAPAVCPNCEASKHAKNSAIHAEKMRFFSQQILNLRRAQHVTVRDIFAANLKIAVFSIFQTKEREMSRIERQRHHLLVERTHYGAGNMQNINEEMTRLAQLTQEERLAKHHVKRAMRWLYRMFGGRRTFRCSNADVEEATENFCMIVRVFYPGTFV